MIPVTGVTVGAISSAAADSAEAANPASFDGSADTGQDANLHSGSDWERYGEVLAVINHLELDPDAGALLEPDDLTGG